MDLSSKEDVYWVGFLLGDGSVSRHPEGTWRLKLCLASKDFNHLCRFSEWFGGDYQMRNNADGTHEVNVYDQEKILWLRGLGVVRNKTDNVRLPELPHNNSLIRGYSDADGYIGAPGGNGFAWSIASNSIGVLKDIKEAVPVSGGRIKRNETAGTNYLTYSSLEQADPITDFLYPEDYKTEPALDRKREAAIERAGWALKKTKDTPLENYAKQK